VLFADGVLCVIDGSSLYTALWTALIHVAKHPPGAPLPDLDLVVRKFRLGGQESVRDCVCLGVFTPNPLLGECDFNMVGYKSSNHGNGEPADGEGGEVALGMSDGMQFYRVIAAGANGTLAQYALPLQAPRSLTATVSKAAERLSTAVLSFASSWWG
jgi:Rab3 GTPase-activating protein regulatory subunit N-terminus